MLLTIETTHKPATDLGYLLHRRPGGVQTVEQSYGAMHIFYPAVAEDCCRVALLLDVDPVAMVRSRGIGSGGQWALGQYVNDRPYAISSLFSVFINRELKSALRGRSAERPELAATPIDLTVTLGAVVCPGGAELPEQIFGPLGYEVEVIEHPLDEEFPQWGGGVAFTVTLRATKTLSELLTHLYVLLPVLDDDKHYWVDDQEIDKLLTYGRDWLDDHPRKERITRRYLKHQRGLTRRALAQLAEDDPDPDVTAEQRDRGERDREAPLRLQDRRIAAVLAVLTEAGVHRVIDLGCGEGALLKELLADPSFTAVAGLDVAVHALERAKARLDLHRMPPRQRERLTLLHGSLVYRDERFRGYDAAVLAEVVEHLDPARLAALEENVFGHAQPPLVVVTTPNAEYNTHFASLEHNGLRHPDHRFEWTRAQFAAWAENVAGRYGYRVEYRAVGDPDPVDGAPAQMGVFKR